MEPTAQPRVVILGGGLSGVAVAHALADAGWREITIVERGPELGGLAGSFERDGHFYPLGYHHILDRDHALLWFLERIGALERVRFRRIAMLFRLGQQLYDLRRPRDFLRFPMGPLDKLRFVRLMLRAFRKSDWSEWLDHDARELVDTWAGPGVRELIFDPLCRLKFQLPAREVSGAWLGARLHFREGSSPLGYIPDANWTKVLCDGVRSLVEGQGVNLQLEKRVVRLHTEGDRVVAAETDDGARFSADLFVSTLPTEVYTGLLPQEDTPRLADIRYTALLSVICATQQSLEPDFYWMNLPSLDLNSCGVFRLESLNPTIGAPGDTVVNFVTHLRSRRTPFFGRSDEELLRAYSDDFRRIFGFELKAHWTHIARVAMYSPIFDRGYRNPPVRSSSWGNVFFSGNYRTFPSIASTGTALASGLETAAEMLRAHGLASDMGLRADAFRLRRPRLE